MAKQKCVVCCSRTATTTLDGDPVCLQCVVVLQDGSDA